MKEFIIENLNTITPYGRKEKKHINIYGKSKGIELKRELDNVEVIIEALHHSKESINDIEYGLCKLNDIEGTIKRLENDQVLNEIELFEVKSFSMTLEGILKGYTKLDININDITFESSEKIIDILDPDKKRVPTYHLYDSYSNRLKEIREEKASLEKQISQEDSLEDRRILKEKRLCVVAKEEEEEVLVKKKISLKLKENVHTLKANISSIKRLDILLAKGKLAREYKGVKPILNNSDRIYLKDGRNPKVEKILVERGERYTPITIDIDSNVTVLTGANMGGKSVTMKMIALNVYLAQCGFYVFGKEANMPIFDFIEVVSDDLQDVQSGVSTFGAEVIKVRDIINRIKGEKGFVVIDEFARGTNPKEGSIILKSLCEYLKEQDAISLLSTHYDNSVIDGVTHLQVRGLRDVDFEKLKYKMSLNQRENIGLELLQESMDYTLERVEKETEIPKDGEKICEILGLQSKVLNIIKEKHKGDEDE